MEQVTLEAIPQVQVAPVQTRRRQRIGLYGGTFNPVHTAHLMVADQVGHALRLNRVDFLPDAVHRTWIKNGHRCHRPGCHVALGNSR